MRAVKAPGFGDRRKAMMEDIAVLTGGKAIFEDLGISLESLGTTPTSARPRRSSSPRTTPRSSRAPARPRTCKGRIGQIRAEIDNGRSSDYDREKLQERLAKLSGGVAQIMVGAATEAEMKEKKARVEDALHATRAAVEEGILPGGGVALLQRQAAVDSRRTPRVTSASAPTSSRRALESPLRQIAQQRRRRRLDRGAERPRQQERYGLRLQRRHRVSTSDLIKAGVIDPAKVVCTALQNAASVATLLLTTEALVSVDAREEEARAAARWTKWAAWTSDQRHSADRETLESPYPTRSGAGSVFLGGRQGGTRGRLSLMPHEPLPLQVGQEDLTPHQVEIPHLHRQLELRKRHLRRQRQLHYASHRNRNRRQGDQTKPWVQA